MGAVWLARQSGKHGFEKQVAIKTILPEYASDPQFHAMFLDEARISSKLSHANVAQILDLGDHEGVLFIVFEWVSGASLEKICAAAEARGGALPPQIALRIVADACAGLHAAHELRDEAGERLRVVHRDVTPQNVLVRDDGTAKVIDFGIAKARDRLGGATRSGVVKGTPSYMAPEQASGGIVDRRADVWSLGAVLFRAFAGAPPFAVQEQLAEFLLHVREVPELPASVPEGVRAAVARAMQRYPSDRYTTAEEMRLALERASGSLGPAVAPADVAAHLRDVLVIPGKPAAGAVGTATTMPVNARHADHAPSPSPTTPEATGGAASPTPPSPVRAAAGFTRRRRVDTALVFLLLGALGVLGYVLVR